MTDSNKPAEVHVVTDVGNPDETVVTTRFNRKKIAKIGATAAAVVTGLAFFGAAMKKRGRDEFIEDVHTANGEDSDETAAS